MNFSLIIPSKDRKEILQQNLDRVAKAINLKNLELIVINDSNEDLILDERYDFVRVYKNEFGGGVASARNYGASKSVHDWLIFMDDDMWVQPNTFQKLEPYCSDKNHCLNINWIYPEFLRAQLPYHPFLRYLRRYGFDSMEGWNNGTGWDKTKCFKTEGVTSQFLLIHKEAFHATKGYNTDFPFAGFEDHDFSKRLNNAGIQIYVDPFNVIFHNEADRIDIENWLERRRRGAITRRVGIHTGYKELELNYSPLKKSFYQFVYLFKKPLLFLLKNWPRQSRWLDDFFFLSINILLGTYSCVGYTSSQAEEYISKMNLKKIQVG